MRTLITTNIVLLLQIIAFTRVCAYEPDSGFITKTATLINTPPSYMGKVKMLRGNVFAGDRELSVGSKVFNEDLIRSTDKSLMVLELIDLTEITLGPNSEFKVEKWKYRSKSDREGIISVLKGQIRALVKTKTKDSDQIKFKTPSVSMGVRGTELLINVMEQLNSEITQVALIEGLIHMYSNENFAAQDVLPGEHLVFIKTPEGYEKQKKELSSAEMNSDALTFLEPAFVNTKSEVMDTGRTPGKAEKIKPWKKTLEELNHARQK